MNRRFKPLAHALLDWKVHLGKTVSNITHQVNFWWSQIGYSPMSGTLMNNQSAPVCNRRLSRLSIRRSCRSRIVAITFCHNFALAVMLNTLQHQELYAYGRHHQHRCSEWQNRVRLRRFWEKKCDEFHHEVEVTGWMVHNLIESVTGSDQKRLARKLSKLVNFPTV